MQIKINVTDKKAVPEDDYNIICGNSDYTISFSFDSEWDPYTVKTARFAYFQNGVRKHIDIVFENNQCNMPILSNTHIVEIGVYAGDLRTTTPCTLLCTKSILCESGTPEEPPEDVYNEIMEKCNEAVKVADNANDAATHQPKIGENNNWFVWDIESKVYVDTGIMAKTNIVQTTGESETDAMSQKATTKALLELANKVAPSPASVSIYADKWEQDEEEPRWHQVVKVANATITSRSKVDLQPSAEQLTVFYEKSLAFVTENDNGVVTVYCIGQKPENDYTIQVTVSEVIV